ncbi:MAG: hypothetical protein Q8R12_01625 [bacterium]|nr:hypothetical protein [bacterium]
MALCENDTGKGRRKLEAGDFVCFKKAGTDTLIRVKEKGATPGASLFWEFTTDLPNEIRIEGTVSAVQASWLAAIMSHAAGLEGKTEHIGFVNGWLAFRVS